MPSPARSAPLCAAVLAVAGCAAPPATAPTGLSVLVRLVQPLSDAAAVAERVGAAAGRPARYLRPVGGDWHSLYLACEGRADCESVLQRLRDDRTAIAAAQRDERKRIVSP